MPDTGDQTPIEEFKCTFCPCAKSPKGEKKLSSHSRLCKTKGIHLLVSWGEMIIMEAIIIDPGKVSSANSTLKLGKQ